MRRMSHVPGLEATLKIGAARPLLRSQCLTASPFPGSSAIFPSQRCRVRYSSSTAPYPERIAILGGGIAGLSSAYFVSREFPKSKITLFEAGKETGGWIKSKRVDVEGGNVLFELGPRTLRNATVTASLIQDLGLVDEITYTKRTEPGAKNRYVYYPDRLNRLPAGRPSLADVLALWRSGIFDGLLGLVREPFVPKRPDSMIDETVGAFLTRRTDRRIANNLASAVFHGIYAGDIWQLSAKTLLSMPWHLEGRYGSMLGGFYQLQTADGRSTGFTLAHPSDVDAAVKMNQEFDIGGGFSRELMDTSMFTFKDGLQTLVKSLQNAVENIGNVEVRTDAPIQSFKPREGGELGVDVVSGPEDSPDPETFDLAISTLRNDDLTPYVTVMTINLYYPNSNLLSVEGFGYLIPQSIPFEQNPERALGVIFDSSAIKGQDTAAGTKLTVMMGGHWWDGWKSYPNEAEGLEMARSVVKRHLNISDEPVAHVVNLSKDCIPQYTIGYEDRLREFATGITSKFKGRLRVVGAQFNGVGVNDCISGAWNVARGLRGDGWKNKSCGLDKVLDQRQWTIVQRTKLAYIKMESDGTGLGKRGDGGV